MGSKRNMGSDKYHDLRIYTTYAFDSGLRGRFTFNVLAFFAYASILMTYLGVNHLLSGLHSYAAGESAPIPYQIWTWLGIGIMLTIGAYFKNKKYYKNKIPVNGCFCEIYVSLSDKSPICCIENK